MSEEGQDMTVEQALQALQASELLTGEKLDAEAAALDAAAPAATPIPDDDSAVRILLHGDEKQLPMLATNGGTSMLVPFGKETIVPRAIYLMFKDSDVPFDARPL